MPIYRLDYTSQRLQVKFEKEKKNMKLLMYVEGGGWKARKTADLTGQLT